MQRINYIYNNQAFSNSNKKKMSNLEKVEKLNKILTALSKEDIGFHTTTDKQVKKAVTVTKKRVLTKLNDLILRLDKNNNPLEVSGDDESIFDNWKSITDILDAAFEKSDKICDSLKRKSHKRKRGDLDDDDSEKLQYLEENLINEPETKKQRIEKPQLHFRIPVDNTDKGPFKPKLSSKPFAIEPLEESLKLIEKVENVPEHYANPYEKEIMEQEYNTNILNKADPIPFKDWNSTSAIWVDNEESLKEMLASLEKYTEIAVDLEHHDLRSYYGLTCLMQISTRDQDYIIDTLVLRNELSILNKVFCDPKITKILHGAFMDIIWLQRDLGIYVVSLFDTYHASRALGFAKHSLAFLLENFANFKTSKQYQLADWRQRPLTGPLMAYARSDTHFLLNIFDKLRNMLIDAKKMSHVLNESRNVAVRRFENNTFRPVKLASSVYSVQEKSDPWVPLSRNYNIPLYLEPLVKELYYWRDTIARNEDESPRYIMSNQFLANLAMTRPIDASGILAINGQMTSFISKNAHSLAQVIKTSIKRINEMKGTNHVSGHNDTSINSITTHDISNEQVLYLKDNFNKLLESIDNCNNESTKQVNTPPMKYIFALPANQWKLKTQFMSYNYNNESTSLIEDTDIIERNKAVESTFATPLELNEEMLSNVINTNEDENETNEDESNAISEESNIATVDKETEQVMGSNGDDVIILNEKRVNQRKKAHEEKLAEREKQIMNENIIPLDYDSGSKMLINPDFRKSKKKSKKNKNLKNKKESFNPYEESATQNNNKSFTPPKSNFKRKKVGSGKSITFKKK